MPVAALSGNPGMSGAQQSQRAADVVQALDASNRAPSQQAFGSAGKTVPNQHSNRGGSNEGTQDAPLRAFEIAVAGERKSPPSWGGAVESFKPWLKSLAGWEMDNHLPRSEWGVPLLQCVNEHPVERLLKPWRHQCFCLKVGTVQYCWQFWQSMPQFWRQQVPAAIDQFFYQAERPRNESFSTHIASNELVRQELKRM